MRFCYAFIALTAIVLPILAAPIEVAPLIDDVSQTLDHAEGTSGSATSSACDLTRRGVLGRRCRGDINSDDETSDTDSGDGYESMDDDESLTELQSFNLNEYHGMYFQMESVMETATAMQKQDLITKSKLWVNTAAKVLQSHDVTTFKPTGNWDQDMPNIMSNYMKDLGTLDFIYMAKSSLDLSAALRRYTTTDN